MVFTSNPNIWRGWEARGSEVQSQAGLYNKCEVTLGYLVKLTLSQEYKEHHVTNVVTSMADTCETHVWSMPLPPPLLICCPPSWLHTEKRTPSFLGLGPHIPEAKELLCRANESKVKKAREACPHDFPRFSRKCPHFGNNLNSAGAPEWTKRNNYLKQRASLRIALFKTGASNCTVQLLGNDTCLHRDNTLQGGKKRKRKLKVSMYLHTERKPQEQPAWDIRDWWRFQTCCFQVITLICYKKKIQTAALKDKRAGRYCVCCPDVTKILPR